MLLPSVAFAGLQNSHLGSQFTLADEPKHLCRTGHLQSLCGLGEHTLVERKWFRMLWKVPSIEDEITPEKLNVPPASHWASQQTTLRPLTSGIGGRARVKPDHGDWQESTSCQLESHDTNSKRAHLNILKCIRSIKALQLVYFRSYEHKGHLPFNNVFYELPEWLASSSISTAAYHYCCSF